MLSSKDGFCSFVRFGEGEFGEEIGMPKLAIETEEAEENKENETTVIGATAAKNPDEATGALFRNNKSSAADMNKGTAPTGRRITSVMMM